MHVAFERSVNYGKEIDHTYILSFRGESMLQSSPPGMHVQYTTCTVYEYLHVLAHKRQRVMQYEAAFMQYDYMYMFQPPNF